MRQPSPGLKDSSLVDRIDAVLPQTQCTKCGFAGCRPYAEAIARGEADINQCPPGGDAGIRELAVLLQRPWKPLNPAHGVEQPRLLAVIDEMICIGCTLCTQACPVDAISGAAKQMHTVVARECSGCELCVAPCPVDCIDMRSAGEAPAADMAEQRARTLREAAHYRMRFEARNARLERDRREKAEKLAARHVPAAGDAPTAASTDDAVDPKKALIAAALARAQAQRAQVKPSNVTDLTPAQQAQIDAAEARRGSLDD